MGAGPPVWFPPSVKFPARPGSLLIQRRCRVLLGKAARSSRSVGVTPRSESATTEPRQALGLSAGSRRDHRAAPSTGAQRGQPAPEGRAALALEPPPERAWPSSRSAGPRGSDGGAALAPSGALQPWPPFPAPPRGPRRTRSAPSQERLPCSATGGGAAGLA